MTKLLSHGEHERMKAIIHGCSLALVATMGAYNLAAWIMRREPHLAINAVVYAGLALWETKHVQHHIDSIPFAIPMDDDVAPQGPRPVSLLRAA